MSIWNILGNLAVSDSGETIQRVSSSMSISSDGTVYTTTGCMTTGSDGSFFTQMGSFSSDGSVRMGSTATGVGALFNSDQGCDGSAAAHDGTRGRKGSRGGF